jgi:hypothetical protein
MRAVFGLSAGNAALYSWISLRTNEPSRATEHRPML